MKIKFLLIILIGLAFTACNSNSKTENLGDSTEVIDSASMSPGPIETDTIDHSGNMKDTSGTGNGTTYTDSI